MPDFIDLAQLSALGQVIVVDLVMAGDNAIVVGLAAAGLPGELRRKAIVMGIAIATVLRILFAATTVQLLQIIGLTFAGGLLLLWVAWKMWRETRAAEAELKQAGSGMPGEAPGKPAERKTLGQAMWQIVVADVSMSLDNVLAVAGAAREHLWVLIVGLVMSIALMGVASTMVARLLERHRWLAYVGLAIIAFVAVGMIYEGADQIIETVDGTPDG